MRNRLGASCEVGSLNLIKVLLCYYWYLSVVTLSNLLELWCWLVQSRCQEFEHLDLTSPINTIFNTTFRLLLTLFRHCLPNIKICIWLFVSCFQIGDLVHAFPQCHKSHGWYKFVKAIIACARRLVLCLCILGFAKVFTLRQAKVLFTLDAVFFSLASASKRSDALTKVS